MKTTTIFTVLGATAMVTATAPGSFYLNAVVTSGPVGIFDGSLLSPFHTGAGENAIVLTDSRTDAGGFYINETALILDATDTYPLSLSNKAPYMSNAPAGYKYVALNVGEPCDGARPFQVNPSTGEVVLEQTDFTFSVCNVNGTSPYESLGPQSQLLWRRPSITPQDKSGKCADVTLYTVNANQ